MASKGVTNTQYGFTDILIIAAYLAILVIVFVLVWKFLSPILAIVVSGLIAYIINLRKIISRGK